MRSARSGVGMAPYRLVQTQCWCPGDLGAGLGGVRSKKISQEEEIRGGSRD